MDNHLQDQRYTRIREMVEQGRSAGAGIALLIFAVVVFGVVALLIYLGIDQWREASAFVNVVGVGVIVFFVVIGVKVLSVGIRQLTTKPEDTFILKALADPSERTVVWIYAKQQFDRAHRYRPFVINIWSRNKRDHYHMAFSTQEEMEPFMDYFTSVFSYAHVGHSAEARRAYMQNPESLLSS